MSNNQSKPVESPESAPRSDALPFSVRARRVREVARALAVDTVHEIQEQAEARLLELKRLQETQLQAARVRAQRAVRRNYVAASCFLGALAFGAVGYQARPPSLGSDVLNVDTVSTVDVQGAPLISGYLHAVTEGAGEQTLPEPPHPVPSPLPAEPSVQPDPAPGVCTGDPNDPMNFCF